MVNAETLRDLRCCQVQSTRCKKGVAFQWFLCSHKTAVLGTCNQLVIQLCLHRPTKHVHKAGAVPASVPWGKPEQLSSAGEGSGDHLHSGLLSIFAPPATFCLLNFGGGLDVAPRTEHSLAIVLGGLGLDYWAAQEKVNQWTIPVAEYFSNVTKTTTTTMNPLQVLKHVEGSEHPDRSLSVLALTLVVLSCLGFCLQPPQDLLLSLLHAQLFPAQHARQAADKG
ncbi:hypothetical protein Y1Q_0012131 [Alligator mississippiensis]|uniref:Uncharacterized protein n=1 Tax=Alligator mississippiensis TaxID=8496 RepID=A0A151P5M1_ALLMI|nr:hypothetical protein Y1Q_0012131 [Alligator mississippiensis]